MSFQRYGAKDSRNFSKASFPKIVASIIARVSERQQFKTRSCGTCWSSSYCLRAHATGRLLKILQSIVVFFCSYFLHGPQKGSSLLDTDTQPQKCTRQRIKTRPLPPPYARKKRVGWDFLSYDNNEDVTVFCVVFCRYLALPCSSQTVCNKVQWCPNKAGACETPINGSTGATALFAIRADSALRYMAVVCETPVGALRWRPPYSIIGPTTYYGMRRWCLRPYFRLIGANRHIR